jgi:hypothetical protein
MVMNNYSYTLKAAGSHELLLYIPKNYRAFHLRRQYSYSGIFVINA